MGSEWKSLPIGEVCHVTDGAHSKVERQTEGVLYLTSKNIKVGRLLLDKVDYISRKDYDRLFPKVSKAGRRPVDGDILIGIIGTFGNAYRYKKEDLFGVSSSVAIIRPNKLRLNSNYLYYVITSPIFKAVHSAYKSGSVQGYTNIPTIKTLPLPIPPLPEQKAIAHILGALDDKIELNRQMNETLESMAQALFKSWFVDFDPVIDNALAAGNPIPDVLAERAKQRQALTKQRKTGGMANKNQNNPAIQEAFPNAFEYTEKMGWIPDGWGVSDAGTEFNTVGGATPSTKNEDFWENGDIHWTTPKDLSNNQTKILLDTSRKITKEGLKKISSGLLPKNTILMSSRAPVGYLALAKIPVAINQGYIAIKCEKTLTPEYAIQWADAIMDDIKQRAGGTTFAEISKKSFRDIPLFVPDRDIVESFSTMTRESYNKITKNEMTTNTLTKLRDTLLPKLLSGELRIPEAERLIEEAEANVSAQVNLKVDIK